MKLTQSFEVPRPVGEVWRFLEQPEAVAGCMPGVEQVSVRTPDDIDVRATQSIGPMSATFAATIAITGREAQKRICFTAQGKTVRGAMGNVRANVVVSMAPSAAGTEITVDGDVALAGALGSVGQKVVAKQAGKVTAEFARNLASALGVGDTDAGAAAAGAADVAAPSARALPPVVDAPRSGTDPWTKATAIFSGIAAFASVLALLRGWRRR